jgi:hypothetical protein
LDSKTSLRTLLIVWFMCYPESHSVAWGNAHALWTRDISRRVSLGFLINPSQAVLAGPINCYNKQGSSHSFYLTFECSVFLELDLLTEAALSVEWCYHIPKVLVGPRWAGSRIRRRFLRIRCRKNGHVVTIILENTKKYFWTPSQISVFDSFFRQVKRLDRDRKPASAQKSSICGQIEKEKYPKSYGPGAK